MAAALPGHIRLKLDQALAQWRHWDCEPALTGTPVIREVLGTGLSNHSVLVEAGRAFVVRIDGISPAANHLNRSGEWRSLQEAHRAGIAPRPCYFNPDLGCMVCAYLPPDPGHAVVLPDVARLLQAVHALPPRHHRLDLEGRILGYEKRLEHRCDPELAQLLPHRKPVMQCLAAAQAGTQALVVCHNDLLRANRIVSGGKLWAIDWEYCAMGSPWYDLAVVATGDTLDASSTALLLESYLGRRATVEEFTRLHCYSCVYAYLELLWYLAQELPTLRDRKIQEKLTRLGSRLEKTLNP